MGENCWDASIHEFLRNWLKEQFSPFPSFFFPNQEIQFCSRVCKWQFMSVRFGHKSREKIFRGNNVGLGWMQRQAETNSLEVNDNCMQRKLRFAYQKIHVIVMSKKLSHYIQVVQFKNLEFECKKSRCLQKAFWNQLFGQFLNRIYSDFNRF